MDKYGNESVGLMILLQIIQTFYKASEDVKHAREKNEWRMADWLKEKNDETEELIGKWMHIVKGVIEIGIPEEL
jgi:hypothetical protein